MPKARVEEERKDYKMPPQEGGRERRKRLDGFLKSTRIRDEQGDTDWQREGVELAQTLTMGE